VDVDGLRWAPFVATAGFDVAGDEEPPQQHENNPEAGSGSFRGVGDTGNAFSSAALSPASSSASVIVWIGARSKVGLGDNEFELNVRTTCRASLS
jgi:hypothetical protein